MATKCKHEQSFHFQGLHHREALPAVKLRKVDKDPDPLFEALPRSEMVIALAVDIKIGMEMTAETKALRSGRSAQVGSFLCNGDEMACYVILGHLCAEGTYGIV